MEKWEKSEQSDNQVPMKQALKQAIQPPVTPKKEQTVNYLLRMQLLICGVLLGLVLLSQHMGLGIYDRCRSAFQEALQQGVEFSGGELVRFTNAAVEQARQTAQQLEEKLDSLPVPQPGAGGRSAEGEEKLPVGYRDEAYVPEFSLANPLDNFYISSSYGWRTHPLSGKRDFHTGLDMAAPEGSPIGSAADGIVLKTAGRSTYGNNVIVLHKDGVTTRYCHMQYIFVRTGEFVKQGSVLGTVGSTGISTGPHLHLELLHDDVGYDPAPALDLA